LTTSEPTSKKFPVVGIGASAGGLEALEQLLEHLPADSGMAFVIVTHQHPSQSSLLPELLARHTQMEVRDAADSVRVMPNHVYVGTPGGYLAIIRGTLQRTETGMESSPRLPIDYFFRSLAEDQKERAICIVLSGTGTDGTLGLRAIKGESGMAMVQQPLSAKYAGMPSSAMATGLADYVLPPAEMPERLVAYSRGPYLASDASKPESSETESIAHIDAESLRKIFLSLRERTGHDFSGYKTNTIRRRIQRRMNIHQIVKAEDYAHYLQANPIEIDLLFKELLISVTSFFRDPPLWEQLADKVLPELLQSLPEDTTLRGWVAGCATGEEVYSLAIVLRECAEKLKRHISLQIFGTDLDIGAIESARLGRFPSGISFNVSSERLQRWFTQIDSTYVTRKEIRELAIFATQSLTRDPPFTKLDIISCRNLLIYLDIDVQKRMIPTFHYALKPGGLLLLGSSESIGQFTDLFETVDSKWKIYRRKEAAPMHYPMHAMSLTALTPETQAEVAVSTRAHMQATRTSELLERVAFERFSPTFVVVNDRGELLHVHGPTGDYLELPQGHVRTNIFDMAREGLTYELVRLVRQAAMEDREISRREVRVKTGPNTTRVDLTAVKLSAPESVRGLILLTFRPTPQVLPPKETSEQSPQATPNKDTSQTTTSDVASLEQELQFLRESHQLALEELGTSNEELRSINEELQSTNEEMQSVNEELETSKEEMQSLNEELTTVNVELQSKIDALSHANDDMQNLLNSTDIATIFLDDNLAIKRYTESATRIVSLRHTDVGRSLGDLRNQLKDVDLVAMCESVIATLVPQKMRVETSGGWWYLMRILPYRTIDKVVDGLVLTFVDIQDLIRAEAAGALRAYFESIFDTVGEPLLVLDAELNVSSANRFFLESFGLSTNEVIGQPISALAEGVFNQPELHSSLEQVLNKQSHLEETVITYQCPGLGSKRFLLDARLLDDTASSAGKLLLALHDLSTFVEKPKEKP
jgi:two-component system, chemotaxis family, CheB/CheR fusion protein